MNELLSDPRTVLVALLSVATGLLSMLLATFAWIGKRKISRLDDIDQNAARKPDLVTMRDEIRSERERLHRENAEKLERIDQTVTATHRSLVDVGIMNQRIVNIEQRVQELRDFKHDHCEPAVRYVDFLKTDKPWERKSP